MPLDPRVFPPVMCLTQDGAGMVHSVQAARLCAAGARWIQLRMKGASRALWLAEAAAAAGACHGHGAVLIVNDSVEVALESGADGVHLGGLDGDWRGARRLLGRDRVLGGTVNSSADALRAASSGDLDYVGVGPFRFTLTKRNLAPLLGLGGVRSILADLRGLPAWVIGGVEPADLPGLREAGAAGVAVSSSLHRGGRIEDNLREFLDAWKRPVELAPGPAALT
jgi:thiamine-phosphate pyrophosphorylase